jgi:hypothetical protein
MLGRQKQVIEAFMRAQAFLHKNRPASATPGYDGQCREFDDVMARLGRALAHQVYGHRESEGETQRLYAAVRRLRDHHIKQLVAIARMQTEVIALDQLCTLPRRRMPVTMLLAHTRALADNVRQYEPLFVRYGMPADFVARLEEASAEVFRTQMRRERARSLHVGATVAIVAHLRRARRVVEVIDSQLRTWYEGDAVRLAEWEVARRVKEKPGVRRQVGETTVESEQTVERAPLTLVAAA